MSTENEGIEEKLKASRTKYISGLPARIVEIKSIWSHLNDQWRYEVMLQMKSLTNYIAGSAGTFGLPKLSVQAKLLVEGLNQLSADHNAPSPAQKLHINNLLINLQEVELATIRENESDIAPLSKSDLIYILDRNKESSVGLSRELMSYGATVKIINEVSALERQLSNARPMVILIDYDFAMTQLEHDSVVQNIRNKWHLECPIVFLSEQDDVTTRLTAIRSDSSAFFTKPIDVRLLIERLQIICNAKIIDPYRILLIEDKQELADFYSLVLQRGNMSVQIDSNPELVLSNILHFNPDIIVMDLDVADGVEILKLIRQHQSLLALPIIVLCSVGEMESIVNVLRIDDVLIKPVSEAVLYDLVLNRAQRTRYSNLCRGQDSLTGLYTHKKINDIFELQLNICRRYNCNLSYAILNVDDFKGINDKYGHHIGDYVITALAQLLKSSMRTSDFLGRYGSDELVIVFPETDEKSALASLERCRKDFAELPLYSDTKIFHATFSAGIASYPNFGDVDSLIGVAEKALFYSKQHGRNRITIWDKLLNGST